MLLDTILPYWPVLVPFVIWACAIAYFPKTVWDKDLDVNGRNNAFRILMNPNARHVKAVWAQEWYESRRKIWRPWEGIIRKFVSETKDWIGRDMELMGHEVEVQAAVAIYKADGHEERRREARSLAQNYRQFRDWSESKIIGRMQDKSEAAKDFVGRYLDEIETTGEP